MHPVMEEDAEIIARADISWDKLAGKRVLIAGASGYVPQNFVHGLLRHNDIFGTDIGVTALCRSRERGKERFGQYFGRKDFSLIIQDVCEEIRYGEKIDFIVHAASPAGIKDRYADCMATYGANVMGCENLIKTARKQGAVLLFISSVDVYGRIAGKARLREKDAGCLDTLEPRNIYANAKRAAETLCMAYAMDGGEVRIVRPFQIMGGGIALDDGRLHADFIGQIQESARIVLKGDGTPKRTFMYVTDAIIGMLMVMLEGGNGEAYNLCWEENECSVLELAQTMAQISKARQIEITYDMESRLHNPAVTGAISCVCGDSAKLRQLGWRARYGLRESCQRTMAYYGIL